VGSAKGVLLGVGTMQLLAAGALQPSDAQINKSLNTPGVLVGSATSDARTSAGRPLCTRTRAPSNALGELHGSATMAAMPVRAPTSGPHVIVMAPHRRSPGTERRTRAPGDTDTPSKHARSVGAGAGAGGHVGAEVLLPVGVRLAAAVAVETTVGDGSCAPVPHAAAVSVLQSGVAHANRFVALRVPHAAVMLAALTPLKTRTRAPDWGSV
jgi:hypothetical protein